MQYPMCERVPDEFQEELRVQNKEREDEQWIQPRGHLRDLPVQFFFSEIENNGLGQQFQEKATCFHHELGENYQGLSAFYQFQPVNNKLLSVDLGSEIQLRRDMLDVPFRAVQNPPLMPESAPAPVISNFHQTLNKF